MPYFFCEDKFAAYVPEDIARLGIHTRLYTSARVLLFIRASTCKRSLLGVNSANDERSAMMVSWHSGHLYLRICVIQCEKYVRDRFLITRFYPSSLSCSISAAAEIRANKSSAFVISVERLEMFRWCINWPLSWVGMECRTNPTFPISWYLLYQQPKLRPILLICFYLPFLPVMHPLHSAAHGYGHPLALHRVIVASRDIQIFKTSKQLIILCDTWSLACRSCSCCRRNSLWRYRNQQVRQQMHVWKTARNI